MPCLSSCPTFSVKILPRVDYMLCGLGYQGWFVIHGDTKDRLGRRGIQSGYCCSEEFRPIKSLECAQCFLLPLFFYAYLYLRFQV